MSEMNEFVCNLGLKTLGLVQPAHAACNTADCNPGPTSGASSITLLNPLACSSSANDPGFLCIGKAIMLLLFNIAIPLTVIMVIVGGFQILTAGGDPEKFKTGRKTLIYAVIGFAIVLISGGVVQLIQNLLNAANP